MTTDPHKDTSDTSQPTKAQVDERIKSSFVQRNYLIFWLSIALLTLIASTVTLILFFRSLGEENYLDPADQQAIVIYSTAVFLLILLATWPKWLLRKLEEIVSSAVAHLGDEDESAFKTGVGEIFDPTVVESIVEYERFLKNEYILHMRKHHFAWLLVAVSGAATVGAALVVVFYKPAEADFISAIGVTLPALVTGALLTIWLETRKNLALTRERTDAIYRQKIRLLFLSAGYQKKKYVSLDKAIEINSKLIRYIRLDPATLSTSGGTPEPDKKNKEGEPDAKK